MLFFPRIFNEKAQGWGNFIQEGDSNVNNPPFLKHDDTGDDGHLPDGEVRKADRKMVQNLTLIEWLDSPEPI